MPILTFPQRIVGRGARSARRLLSGPVLPAASGNWLETEISGSLPERTTSAIWSGGSDAIGLLDFLRALDLAASEPRIDGLLLRMRGQLDSYAQALSLRRGVEAFRAAGKRVAVWAEGLTAESYLVASAADRIWLPESAGLHLVGLRSERFFLKELLDKLDVQPEVVHIGKFKTAGEFLSRSSMSDAEREQIERWQADLWDELVSGIAQGRGLAPDTVRDLIDAGPHPASAAVEAGLVDGIAYDDELVRALEPLALMPPEGSSEPRRVVLTPMLRFSQLAVIDAVPIPLFRNLPELVYLLAIGGIARGSGLRGITSGGMGDLLAELGRDESVRGVALRIDSPGGDAMASDLLHRSIEQLKREKPVVVSMGDVAASGGYYMAAAADAIYAEVGTLTGSIGVVGGKLNLGGLYRRMGVAKDVVETGAHAGIHAEERAFSPDERRAVRREMESVYGTFLDRVASGRNLSREALERVAHGRIWSGRRAQALGLVDAIGGPLDALRDVARRAGLGPGELYRLSVLPSRPSLQQILGQLLGRR